MAEGGHHDPDAPLPVYHAVKAIMRPLVRWLLRPTVEGLDRVPARGPVILCANHLSLVDPVVIPVLVPRPIVYLAKREYFSWRLSRWLFTNLGVVPVDRAGGSAAAASLDRGVQVLRDGGVLSLFPEGTRSPDGRLYRGKTGPIRLALRGGAPIVPIGLIGTGDVVPPHSHVPHLGHPVRVRFGTPLTIPDGEGPAHLRAQADRLMRVIQQLSGQTYVDAYARPAGRAAATTVQDAQDRDPAVSDSVDPDGA